MTLPVNVDWLVLERRTLPFKPVDTGLAVNVELFGLTSLLGDTGEVTPAALGAAGSERRAISAWIAPSHLISSSSLGAQRIIVFFVVTILNAWRLCGSSTSPTGGMAGDVL